MIITFAFPPLGMDKVLGWEPRKPLVAPLDRPRILNSWAPYCSNLAPVQRYVPFDKVRFLYFVLSATAFVSSSDVY